MNFNFDPKNPPASVEFNGVQYRLMGAGRYYLSQSTTNEGRVGAKGLHVAIWEEHHGKKVPPNHCIHHVDGNCMNNEPENLECVPAAKHFAEHGKRNWNDPAFREKGEAQLDSIRDKASEWHRSEAGKAWHREHAKYLEKAWNFREVRKCEYCGKEYVAKRNVAKYCSGRCNQQALARLRGVKPKCEERTCDACGEKFMSKTLNQRFCTRACKNRASSAEWRRTHPGYQDRYKSDKPQYLV